MMFGQRLREVRKNGDKKLTQLQLADMLGMDRSAVAKWETNEAMPSVELVTKIATIFDVSVDYLIGFDRNVEIIDINPTVKLPLYNHISADVPFEEVTADEYIDIHAYQLKEDGEYFCYRIDDSSMIPKYINGDILIIEKDVELFNGRDCILSIFDSNAFLRRVIEQDDGLLLQPLNKAYESMFCDKESVHIYGAVIGLVRFFK